MIKTITFLLLLQIALPLYAKFHDENFVDAKIRTDFENPNRGTSDLPIHLGQCLFDYPEITGNFGCEGATSYSQSNNYSQNGGNISNSYWVLHVNNERAFATDEDGIAYNSGPPGQSLAIVKPGEMGIMGFEVFKECDHCAESSNPATCPQSCDNFYRAHIVLSHNELNPDPVQAIPFLGINAVTDRGNNEPIVQLNGGYMVPNTISFDMKLYDYKAPEGNGSAAFIYIYFISKWKNPLTNEFVNRMLFMTLGHTPSVNYVPNYTKLPKPPSENLPINLAGKNQSWNWPVIESFFYPGADFAYMESEDILQFCNFEVNSFNMPYRETGFNNDGSESIEKSFNINLEALFKCASDHQLFDTPMPSDEVLDVHIVGWANEIGGGVDSHIWTDISHMKTSYTFMPKGSLGIKNINCPYCYYTEKKVTQGRDKVENSVKLNFDFYDKIKQKLNSMNVNKNEYRLRYLDKIRDVEK